MKSNKNIANLFKHLPSDEGREFYEELRFVADTPFVVASQKIKNNVLRSHRGKGWMIYVLSTLLIGVISTLLILNLDSPSDSSSTQGHIANNENPNNTASTPTIDQEERKSQDLDTHEEPAILDHENQNDLAEPQPSEKTRSAFNEDDPNILTEKKEDIPLNETDPIVEANPKKTTQKINEEKTSHSGIKFVSSGRAGKSKRDSSVPLTLSQANVSVQQNLWVRENTLSNSGDMSNGQLNEKISSATTTAKFAPEDMPSYHGGNDKLLEHLTYHVSNAEFKKKYDEPVTAVLSFIVNHKGQMEDIRVMYSSTSEVRSAILHAAQELNQWRKGKKIGKKGSVYYEIVLSFK